MARIDDGHPTTISFGGLASGVTLNIYEKSVTPPGMSGGGENDTTTMRNSTWRTKAPKKLISLAPGSISVSYDPDIYDDLVDLINENQQITITFPDESTLTFWGWIDEVSFGAIEEGSQPTVDITIIPSNQNAAGTETAPVYTA